MYASNPKNRPRLPSEIVSGGNTRIRLGDFGVGYPIAVTDVDPSGVPSIYSFHEGDLFTPGAGNWVFEPNFELPLQTIWGFAFLRKPNTFNPIQPPQVWAHPTVVNNGLGGLQAGSVELEPLMIESE